MNGFTVVASSSRHYLFQCWDLLLNETFREATIQNVGLGSKSIWTLRVNFICCGVAFWDLWRLLGYVCVGSFSNVFWHNPSTAIG